MPTCSLAKICNLFSRRRSPPEEELVQIYLNRDKTQFVLIMQRSRTIMICGYSQDNGWNWEECNPTSQRMGSLVKAAIEQRITETTSISQVEAQLIINCPNEIINHAPNVHPFQK